MSDNQKCPHCGAKNCNRIHENAEVLNVDAKKKERADIYKCRVCWKEHAASIPQTAPIKESDCGKPPEELSAHTTTPLQTRFNPYVKEAL